jgi:hypothetical protein
VGPFVLLGLLVGGAYVVSLVASAPSSAPPIPTPAPFGAGLPAGYAWQDRGNVTPIDPNLILGVTSDAVIIAPDGSTIPIVVQAMLTQRASLPASVAGGPLVWVAHAPDGTWNAPIGPVQVPLSYVVPRPVTPYQETPAGPVYFGQGNLGPGGRPWPTTQTQPTNPATGQPYAPGTYGGALDPVTGLPVTWTS